MELDTVVCADALDFLRTLPDGSVNCVVTSPPYFGLRDYGVDGQIGLEPTPQQFVATMVAVFREVRRVLRGDGVCWINLGDSYVGGGGYSPNSPSNLAGSLSSNGAGRGGAKTHGTIRRTDGFKAKDLMMIPARVAIALQDDGWYLRSEIVWHKPSVMPESVTDRPTKAHEMVYLLTKQPDYWYDQDAIREPVVNGDTSFPRGSSSNAQPNSGRRMGGGDFSKQYADQQPDHGGVSHRQPYSTRNKRTVWTVNPEPTAFAHFATFPRKLIEPMILAGCPDKVCASCGKPWERCVEATGGTIGDHSADLVKGMSQGKHSGGVGNARRAGGQPYSRVTTSWQATCDCAAPTRAGVVLDPFMGSGTTALTARALGRHYIGCDLNPEYVNLACERLRQPFEEHHIKPNNDVSDMPLFAH